MVGDFLNPEKALKQLDLQSSMVAADFGCGSGGWTIPLAKILTEGRIFAVDIVEGPTRVLNSSAKAAKIMNIQTMVSDVEKGTKILANYCDLVLLTNVLFQCKDKKAVVNEAKRVIRQGGKILVVEWKKSASFGPRERAIAPEIIKTIAQELGLIIEKEFEAGTYHYGLVLVK